ncbi:MAG TPA: DUF2341 domain-containing protein [Fibrobacteria bacterium]|nr:DUF2341 domain-containing protein [Fibrobacteria bacterium]
MRNRAQRNVLGILALFAGHLCCPGISRAAEDYAAWTRGTDVLLNTSASGANVASTLNDFPVAVRLTAANFPFSQARGDGRDIRFAKADGSPLAYEIERWDSARALADIWVRMDVPGNTAAHPLRMLWGNPSAPDSSKGASVFRASENFTAVWHLNGSGTSARPNAVAGGNPAVPVAYDGDENRTGVIGGADSLDGAAAGDYLDVGDGYSGFAAGFTYSAWINPAAVKKWAHVLDLGNGAGSDNVIVNRVNLTNNLGFHNWVGGASSSKDAAGQWALDQWQHIAVTLSGKNLRIYKNGEQVLADSMQAVSGANRTANFLGKSNWAADEFFQGKIDETELSTTARSADWIKLAYQNQRAGQTVVTVVKPAECAARMIVPGDTAVEESEVLILNATVECANDFSWSVVSGPSPRIIDPASRTLVVRIPRVTADTFAIYRVSAGFSDSARTRDVRVTIRESVPDPVFTMPALPVWSGKEPALYRPAIANLAAIRASRDSVLHWAWTFSGPAIETDSLPDGVTLKSAAADGKLDIGLCLDNGSEPVCRSASVTVSAATAGLKSGHAGPGKAPADRFRDRGFRGRDAKGRLKADPFSPARPSIRSGTAARPAP